MPDRTLVETARVKRYRLSDLLPDAQNRTLRQWRVDHIANHFDFGKWSPPVVRENGHKHPTILDGHHRIAGACQAGLGKVEVITYCHPPIETDRRVGEMYIGVNDTMKSTPVEKFNMRIRAGDPTAVAIAALVEHAGFQGIVNNPTDGYMQSPGACEWVYNGGPTRTLSPEALRDALALIVAAYDYRHRGSRKDVIRGAGMFMLRYPKANPERVARKVIAMYGTDPDALLNRAALISEALGCQTNTAVARAIHQAYNYKNGHGRLPEWDS